jgi:regulatory protein YycI of two-component signal transduction system YycFG
MKRLLLVAFATSVFAVSACASSGGSSKAADEAWAKQVAAAEASIKDLTKKEAVWRDTGKFLKQADDAYKAGDKEKADKLMKKVNSEIELAGKQYQAEKNAKPHY